MLLILSASQAQAGSSFKVGSFTKSTDTSVPASQSVTHSLGVTPKAIILWTSSSTNESFSADLQYSIGFSDSTTSKSASASGQDAVSTTNTSARMADKAITIVQYGETVLAEADLSSWDSTSLSLSWTTNNATAYVIHYMIIGGTDVSAKVINWTLPTTTGNHAVTGVGFKPVVVLHAHAGQSFTSTPPASVTNARIGLGAMDISGAQWGSNTTSLDGLQYFSLTERRQRTNQFFLAYSGVKTLTWVSMDNDGFTVNDASSSTSASQVISLCLKGVDAKVGSFSKSTSTSVPVSQAVTGMGFQPKAVLLSSFQNTATTSAPSNCRIGLGASDGSTEGCSAVTDAQKSGNPLSTDADRIDKTSKVFMKVDNNSHTIDAEAGLTSFDSGGFTLSWTTNDAVASEILYFALGSIASSAVDLESFDAEESASGVLLRWRTAWETDNLGFHLWREAGGKRIRRTGRLLPGTALLAGEGTAVTAGRSYELLDPAPAAPRARYWLEAVDLDGTSAWHGPVEAVRREDGAGATEADGLAPVHSAAGRSVQKMTAAMSAAGSTEMAPPTLEARASGRLEAVRRPLESPEDARIAVQVQLAGQGAMKLLVKEDGWYRVLRDELIAAGLDPKANLRRFRLYEGGQEVPILITRVKIGRSGPKEAIEFYGRGLDTPWSGERMYWLVDGGKPGKRIPQVKNPKRKASPGGPASFPCMVRVQEKSIYFAALQNGDEENFFGPVIAGEPVAVSLNVLHLDAGSGAPPVLRAWFQGVTGSAHRVRALWNGAEVGEAVFDGQVKGSLETALGPGQVLEGGNEVTFLALEPDRDVSLLGEAGIEYPHTYDADGDALECTVDGPGQVTIRGFAGPRVRVVDITDPENVKLLWREVRPEDGGAAVKFRVAGPARILAVGESRFQKCSWIEKDRPSRLHAANPGADLVVVSHRSLEGSVEPLRALRTSEGLQVLDVDVQDAFDEFGFGEKSPAALKAFLQWACERWNVPPRYVLLVGDASLDPKNLLGLGDQDLVPTKLVDTGALETASDDWLADFDGDGVPDLALGRLPARSREEAGAMAAKIAAAQADDPAGPWAKSALLVADVPDIYDFEGAVEGLAGEFPEGFALEKIFRGEDAQARENLLRAANGGRGIVGYVGHGSVEVWRGGLFSTADARVLENNPRSGVWMLLDCLNGFFQDVYTESLAEALLRNPRGGAAAAWAPSGLTAPAAQEEMARAFLRAFRAQTGDLRLGDALRAAKRAAGDDAVRKTWILLGDPSMRIPGSGAP